MARSLVLGWTQPKDVVADPFCGSGVVTLEAAANNRVVLAGDWNPYAALLNRAKLFAPIDEKAALRQLTTTWELSTELLQSQDLRKVPTWVRVFFHPETLRSALAFRDACIIRRKHFLLGCLLGILHHQRPGFLSYPSSHLVPYRRDRLYPREAFPELYEKRDVLSRLEAKVKRTYRRPPLRPDNQHKVYEIDARQFPTSVKIDAVITSPPYMNELDYVRDNRLRLWFINRTLPTGIELPGRNREGAYRSLIQLVSTRLGAQIRRGGHFILVVGDATRGSGRPGKTAAITKQLFEQEAALSDFQLRQTYHDKIPDIRRARRECSGTKIETVLIYQKK